MNSILCKDCGQVWIRFDPSIKYHSSGKCVPLTENGEKHDFRDCPKSSYNLRKQSNIRAKSVRKFEIKKINDYALIEQAKEDIAQTNNRLENYELILTVKQKRPIFREEV